MLIHVVIFTSIAAVCVAGDTGQVSDHNKLALEQTPREWRTGAVWRFVTTPPPGKPKPEILTLKVTDKVGVSCLGGWKDVWHKFGVIQGGPFPFGPPVYQIEGRALQINLSGEMCDAYDIIDGVLTGGDFTGQRKMFGLGASIEVVGTVRASLVQQ